MCGIAGLLRRTPLDGADLRAVDQMVEALVHRGPDGEGRFSAPHFSAGMRRLAIIDVAGSQQPLISEDAHFTVFFNGEIYNHVELRALLKTQGFQFKTNGDGECILHLYRLHGLDFARHLRGMFAIALWDARARKLILARDRFGEKPLYLYKDEARLVFSSELKSLVASGLFALKLDARAIDQFFHLNFVCEPLTMLEGVSKLPPATVLEVDLATWSERSHCYWDVAAAPRLDERPVEVIRDRLHEAVQFSLRSDRPIGIALSGGLDSSAIASIAATYSTQPVTALSIGYDTTEREAAVSDERYEARQFAEAVGLRFHDIEINRAQLLDEFDDIVLANDDPIADISSLGYASLAKATARQGIPVLLFGMGGDELFAGYPWLERAVIAAARVRRWHAMPDRSGRRGPMGKCASASRRFADTYAAWRQAPEVIPFWRYSLDFQRAEEALQNLYTTNFRRQLDDLADQDWRPDRVCRRTAGGERALVDVACGLSATYLAGNGIPQADRLGMAHSVEARQPLLDHRFAEAVIGAHKASPDRPFTPKKLWKQVLETELPTDLLTRPKRGFRPPAAEWFLALERTFGSRLVDGCLASEGIFTPEALAELSIAKPETRIAMPIRFKALVLTSWYRSIKAIAEKATRA